MEISITMETDPLKLANLQQTIDDKLRIRQERMQQVEY